LKQSILLYLQKESNLKEELNITKILKNNEIIKILQFKVKKALLYNEFVGLDRSSPVRSKKTGLSSFFGPDRSISQT
jgi:hypothetical protein